MLIILFQIFNQSMLSLFSLLYGDALEAMGHNTQGAAIVLSTMLFVSNFGGPIAGVLVKITNPRLVSVVGAISCTSGLFLSGFSTNIWHLILTYGILLGMAFYIILLQYFLSMIFTNKIFLTFLEFSRFRPGPYSERFVCGYQQLF